jgi:hypothetical protein
VPSQLAKRDSARAASFWPGHTEMHAMRGDHDGSGGMTGMRGHGSRRDGAVHGMRCGCMHRGDDEAQADR